MALPGSSSAPSRFSRRNNDLPLHERMKAAEIIESSRLVEGEAKFILSVERRRTELAVRCDYVMRDVVVVLRETVVPTGTVIVSRLNQKLSIVMRASTE